VKNFQPIFKDRFALYGHQTLWKHISEGTETFT